MNIFHAPVFIYLLVEDCCKCKTWCNKCHPIQPLIVKIFTLSHELQKIFSVNKIGGGTNVHACNAIVWFVQEFD